MLFLEQVADQNSELGEQAGVPIFLYVSLLQLDEDIDEQLVY
jgi:hypothetical protein